MSDFQTLSQELEQVTQDLGAATETFEKTVAQSRAELNDLFTQVDAEFQTFTSLLGDTSDLDEEAKN
jgi:chromosome segregation ATPase